MNVWNHPTLGQFYSDGYSWAKELDFQTFRDFTFFAYEWEKAEFHPLIVFEVENQNKLPSDIAAEVGSKALTNYENLTRTALTMLFEDLTGVSRSSGMWWHGEFDEVIDSLKEIPSVPKKLESPEDLYAHLGSPTIVVSESGYGYTRPCAILGFEASFEHEHGIGFLTDGERILGIGYRQDAGAFP